MEEITGQRTGREKGDRGKLRKWWEERKGKERKKKEGKEGTETIPWSKVGGLNWCRNGKLSRVYEGKGSPPHHQHLPCDATCSCGEECWWAWVVRWWVWEASDSSDDARTIFPAATKASRPNKSWLREANKQITPEDCVRVRDAEFRLSFFF